jgi:hypothetical protein
MKYCSITTQSHPVSLLYTDCIEGLNTLLVTEGHNNSTPEFNNGQIVLNLDRVEDYLAILHERDKNKSMDFTFGIANEDKSIQLMVLVEARLNYLNPNNVKREHLEEKVRGSSSALTSVIPIYANYIFLFRVDKKEEARSRFFRMNPRIPNEYFVMDIEELKSTFFQ